MHLEISLWYIGHFLCAGHDCQGGLGEAGCTICLVQGYIIFSSAWHLPWVHTRVIPVLVRDAVLADLTEHNTLLLLANNQACNAAPPRIFNLIEQYYC